jgi:hypothetical protein
MTRQPVFELPDEPFIGAVLFSNDDTIYLRNLTTSECPSSYIFTNDRRALVLELTVPSISSWTTQITSEQDSWEASEQGRND